MTHPAPITEPKASRPGKHPPLKTTLEVHITAEELGRRFNKLVSPKPIKTGKAA